MPTTIATDALTRLAEDVRASAWLLPEGDALRSYLVMLAELPPSDDAWLDVLSPWVDDARHGLGPALDARAHAAALGAVGVAALRAARELDADSRLGPALRAAARWCFFMVRADAR